MAFEAIAAQTNRLLLPDQIFIAFAFAQHSDEKNFTRLDAEILPRQV